MLILGFESTAHTFGAAVVESKLDLGKAGKKGYTSGKILSPSNTKIIAETDMKFPALKEGFIPRKLADFHARNFDGILDGTLEKAGVGLGDLDAVCYSYGPGIGHTLHIGFIAAKSISIAKSIPMIPVNHALSHVEIARFHSGIIDPLAVYVSGGNTQIMVLEGLMHGGIKNAKRMGETEKSNGKHPASAHLKRYHVLGETLDIGLGNYLDQVGRHFRLSPPDAVGVLKQAANGKNLLPLPYIVKGMNTSFSGMLTAVKKLGANSNGGINGKGHKNNIDGTKAVNRLPDICLSAQEYAFSMLLETAERGLTLTGKKGIVGVGGNYRNKRLQEMTMELSKEHKIKCHFPTFELLGDNAGMITITGTQEFASGIYPSNPAPNQKARIDGEIVGW
ncbi:MAG: hypothetical protein AABX01_02055 [Candidatus Micrarchaeota archaeon]